MKKLFPRNNPRFALLACFATVAALLINADANAQSSTPGTSSQSDADILLNMFQKKGLISDADASQARDALAANHKDLQDTNSSRFKISKAIKNMELFGDLRFRYEYRSAQLGPETTHSGDYDTANRLRYALRIGVRGDLADDFYYGLRLETSPNERSTWNSLGNASGGQSPYYGPFSKSNNYS